MSSKKNKLSVEPYKGVRDFYPEDQAFLNYIISTCRGVAERFGYVEYHASVLEPAELYRAKGSDNEEIVNDQTYTFTDRGGREVTLRPEMTPSVARMVAGKRRELGFPLRLFSIPNVFRYERPQRGRLREHWQLNVDIFGSASKAAEAEVIALAATVMAAFGAKKDDFVIKISSRAFLNALMDEYSLPEESRGRFLYLLDRRAKMPAEEFKAELAAFGVPLERLSAANAPADVAETMAHLKTLGIANVEFDTSVVRGFNYYTGVVFEVFDTHKDNNRSLFGGGRYDNLTALFDDEPIAGVGFGMGDVTIQDFLAVRGLLPAYAPHTDVYIALTNPALLNDGLALATTLRTSGVNVGLDFGDKKLADQIKAASKHTIPYLLVMGDDELRTGIFAVRDLKTGQETKLAADALAAFFLKH
jgi:histidyl-tRNA synthetase